MKKIVHIENWFFDGERLHGHAKDHPRFGDQKIISSPVLRIDEVAGVAETKNTLYQLGQKDNGRPAPQPE
jgi:hypothetical protein